MSEVTILIEDLASATPDKHLKVIKIFGQLDESNVDIKIQEIYKVLEGTPHGLNLIFDLEGLEYLNSKSIGYLTDIYGKVTSLGGEVTICKARPNIADILQVVGLTQLVQSFGSVEEAKAHIDSKSGATIPIPTPMPAPVPIPIPKPEEMQTQAQTQAPSQPQAPTQPQVLPQTQAPGSTPQ